MSKNDFMYEFEGESKTPSKLIEQLKGLNDACREHYHELEKQGFGNVEFGTELMLITSELGEALEADRLGKHAPYVATKILMTKDFNNEEVRSSFDKYVKDTVEDEIADAFLRLMGLVGKMDIDIESHIISKSEYNKMRPYKHSKKY